MTKRLLRTYEGDKIIKPVYATALHGNAIIAKKEESPFQSTLSHLRQYERLSWQTRVKWHTDTKLSRRAKELIEVYETYRLRGGKYNVFTFWRECKEMRKDFTQQIFQEVVAWYTAHHSDRIQRMRIKK